MIDTGFYSEDAKFEPYWWETAPREPAVHGEIPAETDVAVVGSGYAGLSAALTLARTGRSVAVFEKEDPGFGASSRNGGAIGANLRISFASMIDRFGLDRAMAYYRSVRAAMDYLYTLIETEQIDCHLARVGRFIGAHKPKDYNALARDLQIQKKHLGFDAETIPRAEQRRYVGTDAYHGGRLLRADGNLHPALYHRALLDRVQSAGIEVFGRTSVEAIQRDGSAYEVVTSKGRARARNVIVATNGYTGPESQWLRRRLIPIQSQIIATEPLDPALVETLIPGNRQLGDTCHLQHYYRTSPDGRRILFGGRAGQREVNNPRLSGAHLYKRLVGLFPELKGARITHSWAGFIAYTFDHLPHMAEHDGIHYVAGFCGSGVAMATYLGHKTALKVIGSKDAANAFDNAHPTRPFYTGKPWFLGPIVWYKGMRDTLRV